MNVKRWFAWLCLVLMVVAEIMMFHANHQRDQALADLESARKEVIQLQSQMTTLTNSTDTSSQGSLVNYLKAQNAALTAKNATLQKSLEVAKAESQATSEHLTTARSALQLQQEHLAQLQAEQEQATISANANACINNLHAIDQAKAQWALDKQKTTTDVPTAQDLLPYLKDNTFPTCPGGGTYSINAVGELPACSIQGHVLSQ